MNTRRSAFVSLSVFGSAVLMVGAMLLLLSLPAAATAQAGPSTGTPGSVGATATYQVTNNNAAGPGSLAHRRDMRRPSTGSGRGARCERLRCAAQNRGE